MYSLKVRQLVAELPNRGEIKDSTHAACRDNPVCGDILQVTLQVNKGVVEKLRFKAQGCAAALASGAALAFLCEGRTVSECLQLGTDDLLKFLGGLPRHKLHGAELAIETLQAAFKVVE